MIRRVMSSNLKCSTAGVSFFAVGMAAVYSYQRVVTISQKNLFSSEATVSTVADKVDKKMKKSGLYTKTGDKGTSSVSPFYLL